MIVKQPSIVASATQKAKLEFEAIVSNATESKNGYKQATITENGMSVKFAYRNFPDGQRIVLLALHGGGQDSPNINDADFMHMTDMFNADMEAIGGVLIATRMPTDTWNGHFVTGVDAVYKKLIACTVAGLNANSNRVYLIGYSAGGDGVYRLGPRMADRWAAVGMYAGHPGDIGADNLRNVFFVGRVGEKDTLFNRAGELIKFQSKLQNLQNKDPRGYAFDVSIVRGKEHGGVPTSEGLQKMFMVTRNPYPQVIVWKQQRISDDDNTLTNHMYWLEIDDPKDGQYIKALQTDKQVFLIEKAENLGKVIIKLNQHMVDLKEKIIVNYQGKQIYHDFALTDDQFIARQLQIFDPNMTFIARVIVNL
jgi:dienelactone hydrolase